MYKQQMPTNVQKIGEYFFYFVETVLMNFQTGREDYFLRFDDADGSTGSYCRSVRTLQGLSTLQQISRLRSCHCCCFSIVSGRGDFRYWIGASRAPERTPNNIKGCSREGVERTASTTGTWARDDKPMTVLALTLDPRVRSRERVSVTLVSPETGSSPDTPPERTITTPKKKEEENGRLKMTL